MSSSTNTNKSLCAYAGCTNVHRRDRRITFFQFPTSNEARLKQWVINCRNSSLSDLDSTELKTRMVCEAHFCKNDIFWTTKRKLLRSYAVPFPHPPEDEISDQPNSDDASEHEVQSTPQILTVRLENRYSMKTYGRPSGRLSAESPSAGLSTYIKRRISTSSEESESIPSMPPPKKNCQTNRRRSLNKRALNLQLLQQSTLSNLLSAKPSSVKVFVRMQLYRGCKTKWTAAEKRLALSIYRKSSNTYKFLLNTLRFVLPSIRTVKSWLKLD